MNHPDDIGYDRAEQRQQAAEDGVMWIDEDDWYDALAGMDLEDQLDTLLAVADGERLVYCTICDRFVPADESVILFGDEHACLDCWDAHQADLADEGDGSSL